VHICTPPVTHEPIAVQVLKHDKDVIVEVTEDDRVE
jgi:predicted dehydrogenase